MTLFQNKLLAIALSLVIGVVGFGALLLYFHNTEAGLTDLACGTSHKGSGCSTQAVTVTLSVVVMGGVAIAYIWRKYFGH